MTYRDVVRRLRAFGFSFERQAKGSHEIWYNPHNRRRTTVPHHPGTLPRGTLHAIIRDTGLTTEQFVAGAAAAPPSPSGTTDDE
jgi:predicted RNA binding protein YcfA (HicA-like mRNA interferase family)